MSNFEAIKLYEAVIEEVISDSRQDFEDSGIDESTLQDLRKIWCQKLSLSGIAKFSWDEEAQREEEELARQQQQQQQPPQHLQSQQQQQQQTQAPLQQQYLQQQLPDTLSDVGLSHIDNTNGLELPNIHQSASSLSYNTHTSNNDILGNNPIAKMEEGDGTGLMIPRINQSDGTFEFTMYTSKAAELLDKLKKQEKAKIQRVGQSDGADDFDDEDIYNDSDDINSDLDDDVESDREDEEVGQDEGQIMLCLYDKVQRVKNKWKSTLKEGVANINGRDYVFQKATGESEW